MGSVKPNYFRILRRPIITEKTAAFGSSNNGVVFEVHPDANKPEIKDAVEKIFGVKVDTVRVVNYMGKIKRVKNLPGRQRSWRKAYISLREGSSIDIVEGL